MGKIETELNIGYPVILCDCPWEYRVWSKKGADRSPAKHYNTMTTADLCALPVSQIAAKDAMLFMWATFPNLLDCINVMDAWGFQYKSCGFVWVKTNRKSPGFHVGLGYYTRSNTELCFIATRGRPKRISKSVRQLVVSPIERHSKKPDCVRERIVELCGDVPRIELFAREQAVGWDALGNEIDGRDIRAALKEITDTWSSKPKPCPA